MIYKKIYFFDLGIFNPYKMKNAKIKVNKAIKENKILFKEEKEWEVRYDNSYPNVFYDKENKIYRCYYSTFTNDEESSKYTLEERKGRQYKPKMARIVSLCYAESKDGINFEKPNLYLTEFNGSKENNIIGHYLHGTSVMYDEDELDENKRYKMFTKIDYGNGIHFIAVAFSKDGINFGEFIKVPNFNPRADTHNHIIFDKDENKYVLMTRMWRDSMRMPCISYSSDFINWSPVVEALASRDYSNQIYSMPMFKKGDYIIGLASMFHEGDMSDKDFDKVDLELAYSYRYKSWNYIEPNSYFIERGEGEYQDSFDSGCIFSSTPVEIDDKTYFYYIGGNGQHTNFREGSLARAYVEKDHFAYMGVKNSNEEAIVYTNGFIFLEDNIYLDAQIEEGGYINIELLENNHEKIEDIKVELIKEGDRYRLKFNKWRDRKLTRLQIKMKNAKIYSIEGALDVFRVESDNSLLRS